MFSWDLNSDHQHRIPVLSPLDHWELLCKKQNNLYQDNITINIGKVNKLFKGSHEGLGFVYIIFLLPLKVQRFFFYYTLFVYKLLRQWLSFACDIFLISSAMTTYFTLFNYFQMYCELQSLPRSTKYCIMTLMVGGEEVLKVIKLLRIWKSPGKLNKTCYS